MSTLYPNGRKSLIPLMLGLAMSLAVALAPASGIPLDDGIKRDDISSTDDLSTERNTLFIVRNAQAKAASRSAKRTKVLKDDGEAQQGVINIGRGARIWGPVILRGDFTKSTVIAK